MTFRLNCLVFGNPFPTDSIFTVEALSAKLVANLKQLVKSTPQGLTPGNNIGAHHLDLWKVSIAPEDIEATLSTARHPNDLGGDRLNPMLRLTEVFLDTPPIDELHIIVGLKRLIDHTGLPNAHHAKLNLRTEF